MVYGRIDEFGRALFSLVIRTTPDSISHEFDVWIDTGFTGELVLSEALIHELGLTQSAMVATALADGSRSVMQTYSCQVDWFGECRMIEVISSQGRIPLLGVGLLLGHRLVADYELLSLSIE